MTDCDECHEETEQGHGLGKDEEGVNSDRMAREGVLQLVTLRGEMKDKKEPGIKRIWEKYILGGRNSKCKTPEAPITAVCWREGKNARVART